MKRNTDKAVKEYLESICDEIVEFQRVELNDLMFMKTKELD
jgi:nucleoid DNA-binding protein